MKAKEFKNTLYNFINEKLTDFKLIKSKELFQLNIENHINNIYVYPTSYSSYFSIQIFCSYDNKKVRERLRKNYPDFKMLVDKGIVGGDCRTITNEILNNTWDLEYYDYIYEKSEAIEDFLKIIEKDIDEIILPFFNLCNSDMFFIYKLLGNPIQSTGFGINYENEILKSPIVAELCNIPKSEIIKLMDDCFEVIKEKKLPYLKNFIDFRKNLGY